MLMILPPLPGNKVLRRRLRHKEHGLDVQIHHVIPVFLTEFKGHPDDESDRRC